MSILASNIWSSKKDREQSLRLITLIYLTLLLLNGTLFLALTIWLIVMQITSCDYLHFYSIEIWLGFASSLTFLGLGIATCVTTSRQKNQEKLRTFFAVTLFGTILQIICAAFASIHRAQVYDGTLQTYLKLTVMKNYTAAETAKSCMDGIQTRFRCCGVTHRHDWMDLKNDPPYPSSCNCSYTKTAERTDHCRLWTRSSTTKRSLINQWIYKRPCLGQVQDKLNEQSNVFRYYCPLSITANFLQLLVTYCFAIKIQGQSVVDIYKVPETATPSRSVSSTQLDTIFTGEQQRQVGEPRCEERSV
ncbi:CD151 antigen-like [Lineus longissimus]|uniref:CD151 antigen-like n=1 Tax=Lineus longissimus TaxID=88925 RepID=UPI002B4E0ED2